MIRPFTAKWHKISLGDEFEQPETRQEFRSELAVLQSTLIVYTKMLADMAGVEDLTTLES